MEKHCGLKVLLYVVIVLFLLMGVSSCAAQAEAHPRIWIDSPGDGAPIPSGTNITVVSHAYAREGVAEVLLSINGEAYRRDAPASTGTAYVQVNQDWKPERDGVYTLQVQAYDAKGQASNSASITVRVGNLPTAVVTLPPRDGTPHTATPVITVTPVISITPPLPGAADIRFWADPAEIKAGACTNIRWQVTNASRVIFGGTDQPFTGSYEDCLCKNQRYTLTVIEMDGSTEKRGVDIAVKGDCATPVPPPAEGDTTPPPAPSPAVPADGLTLSCRANQNLVWLPVSDPSGVAGYYVLLERRSSPGAAWAAVHKSSLVNDKQYKVNVECGWYYRWSVMAEDAVGNRSVWSGYSGFTVTLE